MNANANFKSSGGTLMNPKSTAQARMTRIFLVFLGCLALVMIALTQVHVPKASADVKAVETFECDPDTDSVVFFSGPISLSGSSCTSAMVTLDNNHFKLKDAKGPEAIDRQHIVAGTDTGPGHSYYLMIFWED
jgi:hypothetical protein